MPKNRFIFAAIVFFVILAILITLDILFPGLMRSPWGILVQMIGVSLVAISLARKPHYYG